RVRADGKHPRTGKRQSLERTLPAEATEAELLAKRAELKAMVSSGSRQTRTERITISDYCVSWLEARRDRIRPHVARHYADTLGRKVLPIIGNLYADTIVRADIEAWVSWAEQSTQGDRREATAGQRYAQETLSGWWRVARMMLQDMAADVDIQDPTHRIRGPKSTVGRVTTRRTLTAPELGAFVRAAQQLTPDRYAEIVTLAFTGIRPSELYGLQWDDIEADRGRAVIRRSFAKGHLGQPKTESEKRSGRREVALPAPVVEALRAHRMRMIAQQHKGLDSGLVFPSRGGKHRFPSSLTKPMDLATNASQVPVRVGPLVLRRTFNTLLIESGVSDVVLRAQMGHSSAEMTERYAGIGLERKADAVMALVERASQ
ncbi:MAG: integrase, partial [Myxococcota bacterium]